jgi:hypothetical protein
MVLDVVNRDARRLDDQLIAHNFAQLGMPTPTQLRHQFYLGDHRVMSGFIPLQVDHRESTLMNSLSGDVLDMYEWHKGAGNTDLHSYIVEHNDFAKQYALQFKKAPEIPPYAEELNINPNGMPTQLGNQPGGNLPPPQAQGEAQGRLLAADEEAEGALEAADEPAAGAAPPANAAADGAAEAVAGPPDAGEEGEGDAAVANGILAQSEPGGLAGVARDLMNNAERNANASVQPHASIRLGSAAAAQQFAHREAGDFKEQEGSEEEEEPDTALNYIPIRAPGDLPPGVVPGVRIARSDEELAGLPRQPRTAEEKRMYKELKRRRAAILFQAGRHQRLEGIRENAYFVFFPGNKVVTCQKRFFLNVSHFRG